jgi:sugar phosphate isomerase/epimerase
MSLSRRNLLKLGAGAAALWATGTNPLRAAPCCTKKIPIGLQLYSVRGECAKDLKSVIEAVAKMGYQGVEFAGYHGKSAEEISKMLKDAGLVCCGTHTGWNTLQAGEFDKTVQFNKTIGNKYLIVPGLPHDCVATRQAVVNTAKIFTDLAAKAKPLGMYVGYHAHGGDFKKFDNETVWDILFSNAGPDVVMQMDVGNCLGGGGDPYATLKKFPGRSVTIHLKEYGGKPGAAVGDGDVKWNEVFQLCETTGKTQWYIVEQESYAGGPLDAVKQCIENLKKMGKA